MPGTEKNPQTLYDKVLSNHIVDEKLDGTVLLYIGEKFCRQNCTPMLTDRPASRPRSDISGMYPPVLTYSRACGANAK